MGTVPLNKGMPIPVLHHGSCNVFEVDLGIISPILVLSFGEDLRNQGKRCLKGV